MKLIKEYISKKFKNLAELFSFSFLWQKYQCPTFYCKEASSCYSHKEMRKRKQSIKRDIVTTSQESFNIPQVLLQLDCPALPFWCSSFLENRIKIYHSLNPILCYVLYKVINKEISSANKCKLLYLDRTF